MPVAFSKRVSSSGRRSVGAVGMRPPKRRFVLILLFSFVGKPQPFETVLHSSLLSNSQECL